jgi:hypothetical protein
MRRYVSRSNLMQEVLSSLIPQPGVQLGRSFPQRICPDVESFAKTLTRGLLVMVIGLTLIRSAASAQQHPLTRMGGLVLGAYGGGAAYSDLQRSPARAELLQPPGTAVDFTRRLSPETSAVVAVSGGYWFSQKWGARLRGSVSPTRFTIAVSEREAAEIPTDTTLTPRAPFVRLTIWTFDAELLYRIPVTPRGRVAPYAFLGGGVVQYVAGENGPLPPEASNSFNSGESLTRGAGVIGLGAIVPLQRRSLALTFELTDHIDPTPVDRPAGGTLGEGQKVRIVSSSSGTGRVDLTHNVGLVLGLSWLVR